MLIAAFLALLAFTPQGNNVTLRANVDSYAEYNEVWGYTAPDGREYAIIGTSAGTAFYNCTNPSAPYLTGFIAGPNSIWREMKCWDAYCYIVTEGGGGMQIVSLVNPEAPALHSTWGANYWSHAHTISVDQDAGLLYVNGTDAGVRVVNVANPTSPTLVATYTAYYAHDCHPQHGLAHMAEIYDGRYRILDVDSLPAMPSLDSIVTQGQFTHNVWANAIDTIACTTDENQGGKLGIYDITDPANILLRSNYTINSNSTVHNVHLRGNRAHCSWYTQGYVCVDISDPSAPALVGSYDTNALTGTGYEGAWGCYPFAPSGIVYISDRSNGLYVLEVDDLGTDSVLLAGPTQASPGSSVTLSLHGGFGGVNWFLYRSRNVNGTLINGQPFDIGTPYVLLGTGLTDLHGDATWTSGLIPPRASGHTLQIEGRVDGAQTLDSNLLTITFL